MAFYNPKTNDIWADSNIEGFLEDCVEIDEVIAPLIQELNKRGYRTRFCCSGHPLLACNEVFTDAANAENCIADVQSVEKTADPEYPYRVIVTPMENDFYIFFDTKRKGDFSQPLPTGFEWDGDSTIRYRYRHSDFYLFLAERAMAAERLHFWATQLPKIVMTP